MKENSIRFGISTASFFNRMPLHDILSDLGKHNITDCEIFLNSWSEYHPVYISSLKERIDSLGTPLTVNSIHPMGTQFEPQLFSRHAMQRKDALFVYEQVLKAASQLNAKIYVMHGPIILDNGPSPLSVGRFVPYFNDLSDMAAGYGVMLSLENVSWCLFRNPEIGKELADSLGDKLHFTLDIKQGYRSGKGYSPQDYIDAVGPLIVNVHLNDHVRTETGFQWLLPGKGEIDWQKLMSALAEAGYCGGAFIESYSNSYGTTDELYASLEYLKRIEY